MSAVINGQPARRLSVAARVALRRGTRVGHYCSSAVGLLAIAGALALWFQPGLRAMLAESVLPSLLSDPQGGATRLLKAGVNVPHVPLLPTTIAGAPSPAGVAADVAVAAPQVALGNFSTPLDPANLPASVVRLAMPAALVADARVGQPGGERAGAGANRDQARVASYIARRYRVAQEPIDTLVRASFQTGRDVGLDPLLLLAVMAVESGFNPYAESGVGARGLMQVMPTVHSDKFQYYGGPKAALEPVPNLRVGALILKDYIGSTGSIAGGLRRYVGATTPGDGGYGAKVLAERARLHEAVGLPGGGPILTASVKPHVATPAVARPAAVAAVAAAPTSEHVDGAPNAAANDDSVGKTVGEHHPDTSSEPSAAVSLGAA
ncbi:MAG: transglycosylase SLT domain-containing protein [Janthinobacterium lividum]